METLPPGIFAFASVLAFVLACGLVAWLVRAIGRGGKKSKQQPSPSPSPSPPTSQTNPSPASQAGAAAPKATGRQELLSVVRTEEGGLTVLVRGQPRRRLREINDPRLGQDTIEAIQAVLTFAEGWIPFIQKWSAETSADTHVQPTPDRKPHREPPRRDVSPHPSRPPSSLSRSTVPRPDSMLEPLPLIDEINDLVQKRLRENPDLADHLITLTTAIDGSLRIYVDQQAFQTIDDVADPRVRALIQSAIHEWEEH